MYLHRTALSGVGDAIRRRVESAERHVPDLAWNVVKLSENQLSLLLYEDFDAVAFPALLASAKIDEETGTAAERRYDARANPPILHRKETLLRPDDARIPVFAALTRAAEAHGLFKDAKRIGTRSAWDAKIKAAGLVVLGHQLLREGERLASISRHRTAIARRDVSQPVSLMIRSGILEKSFSVFDYGCGQGGDVAALSENGYEAFGWDPHFAPDASRKVADIVNLGFVLNVIEDAFERVETLKSAWSFAARALTVSVMLPHQQQGVLQPYKDGGLTARGTFQRYFTPEELRELVACATGAAPLTLAPGVVTVFRDKELEQEARYRRHSRAIALSEDFKFTPRPARAAIIRPDLRERIADTLDAIWRQALALGRLANVDELEHDIVASLAAARVAAPRAISLASQIYPAQALDEAAEAHKEDALVHLALNLFPGAPKYSALSRSMQRDVKSFFRSHALALEQARQLLFGVGEQSKLVAAMESAVAQGLGGLVNKRFRFLSSQQDRMPSLVRLLVGCAEVIDPDLGAYDFLEVDLDGGDVRGIRCINPYQRLPIIAEMVKVNVKTLRGRRMRPRGAVLYLRSQYLPAGFEGRHEQAQFDARLLAEGIVSPEGEGPDAPNLADLLKSRGLAKSPVASA